VDATEAVPAEYWQTRGQFPIDIGIDFGRKHDLTVAWSAEAVADLQVTREVLCLRGVSTPEQVDILRPRITRARRVALDYTGGGIGLGDYLVKEFGQWDPEDNKFGKVELCTFTATFKQELFPRLRVAFEKRNLRIPGTRAIREDLHSIHRVTTPSGNITYKAPLTDDGHADRCTALALCVHARGEQPAGIISLKGTRIAPSVFKPALLS
jgi:phage FluMu gp28-like protein